MKKPILSREEAFKLAQRFEATEDNDNIPGVVALTPIELEQFVSAILEKLCGEPIYQARQLSDELDRWDDVYADTHSACASQPQFYDTRIVYALNRSKA